QLDCILDRHAALQRLREVARRCPLRPFHQRRIVRALPVHEAEYREAGPALQKVRMERLLLVRLLEARQDQADVADGAFFIRLRVAAEARAAFGLHLDAEPAFRALGYFRIAGEVQLAFAVVQAGERAGRIALLEAGPHDRLGILVGLQRADVAL